MTLTLEISPEAEALLRTNATVRGQAITEYLLRLAENDPVSYFKIEGRFKSSSQGQ